MTMERTSPSPLAGEGAEREKREAGEGARFLTQTARKLRSQMTDAERNPHPTSRLLSTSPSPARGEGKNQEGAR